MKDEMQYSAPGAPAAARSNGLGLGMSISGLVVGILSLLLSFVPCVGALALWPGILASGLSLVGVLTLTAGKGLGIAALVISLASVGMAIKQQMLIKDIGDDLKKGGTQFQKDLEASLKKAGDQLKKEAEDAAKKAAEESKKGAEESKKDTEESKKDTKGDNN